MAKTDAERARDYRARKREQRGIVPVMPAADHAAFRAKARLLAEQQRDQIAALEEQIARLEEQQAGKRVPPCKACGGELACPACCRYGGGDFD